MRAQVVTREGLCGLIEGCAPASLQVVLQLGLWGCGSLVVVRERLVYLYCRLRTRTATSQAATGVMGLRAMVGLR